MGDNSNELEGGKAIVRFDRETIEREIRDRVRDIIENVVEAESEEALGAKPSERVGEQRRGYRHGYRERTLTSSVGPTRFTMPRGRVKDGEGGSHEWRSRTVERYERPSRRVDEAIVGVYLSGANTQRIREALAPLLRGGPLSKDAVLRLVGRLKEDFEQWRRRDLKKDKIRYLYMDGWYPKVRIDKKRVRVPVLVTLGTKQSGERVVLDLRIAGDESGAAWGEVIDSLVKRHIRVPALAVIDGGAGLAAALEKRWKKIEIQRCTTHKLRNLLAKAPVRMREELAEDYRRMIYAEDAKKIAEQRVSFRKKWRLKCAAVVDSLDEAGEELFTFTKFPRLAVEGIANDERDRTDQRGVPPPDEDASKPPWRGGGAAADVRLASQRAHPLAPHGGLEGYPQR